MKAIAVSLGVFFAGATAALAHAFLAHANPPVGSTVRGSPREVTLQFTEPLEPAFSGAQVVDAAGRSVSAGRARVDPANGQVLHVPLRPLAPGSYRVIWRVVSVDTHVTQGDFRFTVAP